MAEFKVGDRVRRRHGEHAGMNVGDIGTVAWVAGDSLKLQEYPGPWGTHDADRFELVQQPVTKATNPKQAFADGKAQLGLVPDTLAYAAGMAFTEGALKYGAYNWRVAGVRASTYKAAAERHLKKWYNGEDCDPKTGVPHLANAIACLAIIVDADLCAKLEDDRPPRVDIGGFEEVVAKVQASLREQHADKAPTHWTAKGPA